MTGVEELGEGRLAGFLFSLFAPALLFLGLPSVFCSCVVLPSARSPRPRVYVAFRETDFCNRATVEPCCSDTRNSGLHFSGVCLHSGASRRNVGPGISVGFGSDTVRGELVEEHIDAVRTDRACIKG